MLASAYAHTQNKTKAIDLLKSIISDEALKKEAMKNTLLKPYIEEIEKAKSDELKQKQKQSQNSVNNDTTIN